MKNSIKNALLIFALIFSGSSFAQHSMKKDKMESKAEVVQLTQVEGDFKTTKGLTLEAGKAYVFEVANEGVDHAVGFVIAPKGKIDQEHHIKNAYVKEMVADGMSSTSQEVVLAAGEYEYFCPLNPTPHYTITVK